MPVRLNSNVVYVEAVVIPTIRTRLQISRLPDVCKLFLKKNYDLADKWLYEPCKVIDNLSMIFGADTDALLPLTYERFGISKYSCYIQSSIGVMLTGSAADIMLNANCLPTNMPSSKQNRSPAKSDKGTQDEYLNSRAHNCDSGECCSGAENATVAVCATNTAFSDCRSVGGWQESGELTDITVTKLSNSELDQQTELLFNYSPNPTEALETDTNVKICEYIISKTERDDTGRLIMPLPWNNKNVHLLASNFNLAKQILNSTFKKLSRDPSRLQMYSDVFAEQEALGIIKKVENVETFREENPQCSFLAHMGVFRFSHDTTKCRVVFLSNICDAAPNAISHNQALLAGPCLNNKISTALTLLRFDRYLLTYDLQKAFLMIKLREIDQNRLAFLWYKNVAQSDFTIVAYKNTRLSFGLRPSPCMLMLALYKILILDNDPQENLTEFKQLLYHLLYMDNGGYSCNKVSEMEFAYSALPKIFSPYKFSLQQYCTNIPSLQNTIDTQQRVSTTEEVNLLGTIWNRDSDTLTARDFKLDFEATTKRGILKSLNSIYDILNVGLPLLNRAKLFLQTLQQNKSLSWDDTLAQNQLNEWQRIAKQVNSTPPLEVPRFVGERSSVYVLRAFCDASQSIVGTVIYIHDLRTDKPNFLCAKNKIIGRSLEKKSIPSLELEAATFAVKLMKETYTDLAGPAAIVPLNINSVEVFTDSMVVLSWLRSFSLHFDKMQRLSVFVQNRLEEIDRLCRNFPVNFYFTGGTVNPADAVSRPLSYKQLCKTTYLTGPSVDPEIKEDRHVRLPNPCVRPTDSISESFAVLATATVKAKAPSATALLTIDKYSSFEKVANVTKYVLKFINTLKKRINTKREATYKLIPDAELYRVATFNVISNDQQTHFAKEFEFLAKGAKANISEIPSLVSKLNVFVDSSSILRVKSKFSNVFTQERDFPILLHKDSYLTTLIIRDLHIRMMHSGIYATLKEFRKQFFIKNYFSAVRKVLKECVTCRRHNSNPVKLNQSSYREFRVHPLAIPFRSIFIDYMGPWQVTLQGSKVKVWLLVITCLWSRAINLKVCISADTKHFLRAMQQHIFEHGLFQRCYSDQGSQITAGSKVIQQFLDDHDTFNYLRNHGIEQLSFNHFCKGNSALGSLVETCVKQTKRLINKTIRTNIVDYFEFEFLITKTVHLINKRPIAFQHFLRDSSGEDIPVLSPEILLRGYELPAVNIVPAYHESRDLEDPDWSVNPGVLAYKNHDKITKIRKKLTELYHSEFLSTLVSQATDKSGRFTPVPHTKLEVGDIVLLPDKHIKAVAYPMGIVKSTETNALGEVTAAIVLKGGTRETVYRHASSLILLLPAATVGNDPPSRDSACEEENIVHKRAPRHAALAARRHIGGLVSSGAV